MGNTAPLRLRFDAFDLDEDNARLSRDGQPIALAPKAFAVLCTLARQPGQLVTKAVLLDMVWGHQHVSESVLKTVVSELREALSDDAKQPRYIETVSRRGYRFIGALQPASQAPSNQGGTPTLLHASPMVGRKAALARLRAAWDSTAGGRRQIFWVVGEPGVGKTTLIENFAAGLAPVPCAFGQCVEQYGAGEPYLPVLDALASLCRNDPALAPLLRAVAPTWLLQLPWLTGEQEREALRRELTGVGQERMLRELGELLDRYTQQRPLLLVTEDLHWSDHATVRLIDHVARRRNPARLMWLATFRLAEVVDADHPLQALRHELRLHRLCDEIVLDPFSEQEVADYIFDRFPGTEVSETFVRALHSRTDGLPLFVVNVIDDLTRQRSLPAGAAADLTDVLVASSRVPENLAGVIERQIARLRPEQRALLEGASVCGVEFRPATVGDALGREASWAAECCDELAREQQWLSAPALGRLADGSLDARYAFRHALYRHVFYQRIGTVARAQLHQRVAISLQRSRAAGVAVTAVELASHFEQGRDPMAALRHYAEAAESALRHFAPKEAMTLTGQALTLLRDCPETSARDALELALSALRGTAAAQQIGVSSLEAKDAFERAHALLERFPDHPLRAVALHGLGLGLLVRAEYAEARALCERLRDASRSRGDPFLLICACSVLGQVGVLQGRYHEALEWLERGIAACEKLGDEALGAGFAVDPPVTMRGAAGIPWLYLGRPDHARSQVNAALLRAQRLGQPIAKMVANWYAALLAVRMRDPTRVTVHAAALRQVVDEAALAQGEGPARWYRGWIEAQEGAPHDGYRRILDAFAHNTRLGMYSGASEVLGYAAEALVLAGEWPRAQAQLDEAMRLAERLDERTYIPQMLWLKGRIAGSQKGAASAREAMEASLREARVQQAPWLELSALVALCELDDATPADLEALARVRAGIHEGLDTVLIVRAEELLGAAGRAGARPTGP